MKIRPFDAWRRFRAEPDGSITITTAVMLIVILAFIGAAVDSARIAALEEKLQRAADAATLAAVGTSSELVDRALIQVEDGAVRGGEAFVKKWFDAAIGGTAASVSASVERQKTIMVANVQYSANLRSGFLGVIGFKSFKISGSASAKTELNKSMDFHLLLDNSPSMGVGATTADIDTMVANTPDACAFACHDTSNASNYYDLAKTLGVTTRIDVLRKATQKLMTTAQSTEMQPDQFRTAIYTFSRNVQKVSNLTSDLNQASSSAAAIDLVTVPHQGDNNDEYTDYDGALAHMNNMIPDSGTGAHGDPIQILFLVTDGVGDSNDNGTRKIAPIDTALCDTIKNRGVKIALLYTTYLPLPTNGFYMANVDPWISTVSPTMQACASPGYFFEVSPSEGIAEAMNALFLRVTQQARLTK